MSQFPNWKAVKLVIFDVDGTLYEQRPLRMIMAGALLRYVLVHGDLETPFILLNYRRWREEMADAGVEDFEPKLIARLSKRYKVTEDRAHSIIHEWIERHPLKYLQQLRYPGVPELFQAVRRSGRRLGILSDYPAREKLTNLGLSADYVVCATDADVGVMKPDARGLGVLLSQADLRPEDALLIGDRPERDGKAGLSAGVPTLIRTKTPIDGWQCFNSYTDLLQRFSHEKN